MTRRSTRTFNRIIRTSNRRRGGGGAVPVPKTIAGLVLWLKADEGPDQTSGGSAITTWTDQSDEGNDFTQTGTKRPTIETNELNSLPVIRFDGVDDFLEADTQVFDVTKDYTIFAVAKSPNTFDSSAEIIGSMTSSGGVFLAWHSAYSNSIFGSITGSLDAYHSSLSANTWHYLTLTVDSVTGANGPVSLRMDGSLGSNGGPSADKARSANNANTSVGGTTSSSLLLAGDIAEILVYESALSSDDVTTVEDYITDKYGL
jgi:hypothetical protein